MSALSFGPASPAAGRPLKALILNGNSVEAAMEWLFQHCEDADIDTPLTQAQLRQLAARGRYKLCDASLRGQITADIVHNLK